MTHTITEADERRWRDPTGKFYALVEPGARAFELRVVYVGIETASPPRLEILVEPFDDSPLDLDKCADLSRLISAKLDVEDPIASEYILDVGSAGSNRPLTSALDFERFKDFTVRAKLTDKAEDGRQKVKGTLKGANENGIVIEDKKDSVLTFAPAQIAEISLVADEYYFDRVRKGTFPKPVKAGA